MTNRIDKVFAELQLKNKKALLGFIMAGDPSIKSTKSFVLSMVKAGADIIELGIPFSDPVADGPVIQAAAQRSRENGTNITKSLELVCDLRITTSVPLVFLIYYNLILQYGVDEFLQALKKAGVDGIIVPDLPLEENCELLALCYHYEVHLIPMITPTSEQRITPITQGARGFVYCVSSTGVTGMRTDFHNKLAIILEKTKQATPTPRAIGFGISDSKAINNLKNLAEGFIIGSALVKIIEKGITNEYNDQQIYLQLYDFVKELRDTLDC